MRISDWSSDVCSSDLGGDTADQRNTVFEGVVAGFIGRFRRQNIGQYANAARGASTQIDRTLARQGAQMVLGCGRRAKPERRDDFGSRRRRTVLVTMAQDEIENFGLAGGQLIRSEEHTSELQSLMRKSYAVFCLKKKHDT